MLAQRQAGQVWFVHLDLKLVSVKLAVLAFALPTFSLAFWKTGLAGNAPMHQRQSHGAPT